MTRDEILNMPAGREMDALIAEKVMGTPFRKPTHGPCCTCGTCGWDYDDCKCGYSEGIEKAWKVVEEMKRREWDFVLSWNKIPNAIFFHNYHDLDDGEWCPQETAPLAICRAALLAVMGE